MFHNTRRRDGVSPSHVEDLRIQARQRPLRSQRASAVRSSCTARDDAIERHLQSAKAVEACARRWYGAGRDVIIVEPDTAKDLNDELREAAR